MPRKRFRAPERQQQYESVVSAYRERRRILFTPDGLRCRGNSFAAAFWAGYDGFDKGLWDFSQRAARGSVGYIFYVAGRDMHKTTETGDPK